MSRSLDSLSFHYRMVHWKRARLLSWSFLIYEKIANGKFYRCMTYGNSFERIHERLKRLRMIQGIYSFKPSLLRYTDCFKRWMGYGILSGRLWFRNAFADWDSLVWKSWHFLIERASGGQPVFFASFGNFYGSATSWPLFHRNGICSRQHPSMVFDAPIPKAEI